MCYQLAIASCQIKPRLRLLSLIRALNLARNDTIPAENIRADEECMIKLEMHDKLLLYSPIIPPHAAFYSLIFFFFFRTKPLFCYPASRERERGSARRVLFCAACFQILHFLYARYN